MNSPFKINKRPMYDSSDDDDNGQGNKTNVTTSKTQQEDDNVTALKTQEQVSTVQMLSNHNPLLQEEDDNDTYEYYDTYTETTTQMKAIREPSMMHNKGKHSPTTKQTGSTIEIFHGISKQTSGNTDINYVSREQLDKTLITGFIRLYLFKKSENISTETFTKIILLFFQLPIYSAMLTNDEVYALYDMISDKINSGKNKNENKIEWNLKYRASRDGFGYGSFWNRCHNLNNSLIMIETADKQNIFGGFNGIPFKRWDNESAKTNLIERLLEDKNAFLYTLRCNKGCFDSPEIFPIEEDSWGRAFMYIPNDGNRLYSHGFYLDIKTYSDTQESMTTSIHRMAYELPYGYNLAGEENTTMFLVHDIEVFQLVV